MAKIDNEIKTNFSNSKDRFMANLMFTSHYFQNLFVDMLKPYGLSPQQLNVLRILRGTRDGMTVNSIKDLMVDKAPHLTRLSDKLIDKNLIERKRSDNDRRVVFLKISENGLKLLKKMDNDKLFDKMNYIEVITEEEAEKFSEILDRIRG